MDLTRPQEGARLATRTLRSPRGARVPRLRPKSSEPSGAMPVERIAHRERNGDVREGKEPVRIGKPEGTGLFARSACFDHPLDHVTMHAVAVGDDDGAIFCGPDGNMRESVNSAFGRRRGPNFTLRLTSNSTSSLPLAGRCA